MPVQPINSDDLVIHILNVGHGDAIIIGLPAKNEQERIYGLVDCYKDSKVKKYLNELYKGKQKQRLAFICATHPHSDHIAGISSFITDADYCPHEFWESGFRHNSNTYRDILVNIMQARKIKDINVVRVSSGMEWFFGKVRISALSPSVVLRNKYVTYGVDMNNASIVLRLEHCEDNVLLLQSQQYDKDSPATPETEREASQSVVILGGDAEFDAWAQVSNEYPKLETDIWQGPLVKKMINLLNCYVVKVSHHGSMHSAPLDMYEKMSPAVAIVSCEQKIETTQKGPHVLTRGYYPHPSAIMALEECGTEILTTDGSYETEKAVAANAHPGTIMIVIPPGGRPRWKKLDDDKDSLPTVIPDAI